MDEKKPPAESATFESLPGVDALMPETPNYANATPLRPDLEVKVRQIPSGQFHVEVPFPKQAPFDLILTNNRNVPVVSFYLRWHIKDKEGRVLVPRDLTLDAYEVRTAKTAEEKVHELRQIASPRFFKGERYYTGLARGIRLLPPDFQLDFARIGPPADGDIYMEGEKFKTIEVSVEGVLYADGQREGNDLKAFEDNLKRIDYVRAQPHQWTHVPVKGDSK